MEDLLPEEELRRVREEAALLSGAAVLDRAVAELSEVTVRHVSVR